MCSVSLLSSKRRIEGTTGKLPSPKSLWQEQLILEAIVGPKANNKIIRSSQGKVVFDQLDIILFYNEITSLVDKDQVVDVIYQNFSKAFDTVSTLILRAADEVWAGQAGREADWKQAEQMDPQHGDQYNEN